MPTARDVPRRTREPLRLPPMAPIVQMSTPALIADQLRKAIATGAFAPGQQLLETQLATSLGVSRGPLREAMQRLTQEGLLVSHRNRGLFVIELDDDAVADMYRVREALERAAIEHVIVSGRAGGAAVLRDIIDEMRTMGADPGHPSVSDADMRFHTELVAMSESPRLVAAHSSLITQIRMCLSQMQPTYSSVHERASEHEAIVNAILAEDAALADHLLREHMRDGLERLRQEAHVSLDHD